MCGKGSWSDELPQPFLLKRRGRWVRITKVPELDVDVDAGYARLVRTNAVSESLRVIRRPIFAERSTTHIMRTS